MRVFTGLVVTGVFAASALSAPVSAPVRAEIDALLARLQSSGCEFNRNGSWYSGADAKTHLLRKLQYLENRTTLRSAEQFIELAATFSSSSGQAYKVKCAGEPVQPSAQWLTKELALLRTSGRSPTSTPK